MDTPIGTPSTSHGGRAPGTVRSKNAVAQQSALSPDEIDPATRMLYTPHTVTGLIIGESGTPQLGICLLRLLYFVFYVCGEDLTTSHMYQPAPQVDPHLQVWQLLSTAVGHLTLLGRS